MEQKVIVASTNPVKIQAVEQGFARMFAQSVFNVEGHAIPSGVSDQPIGHAETLTGARQRALGALDTHPEAHYGVGIEGGVARDFEDAHRLQVFAWVVVGYRQTSGDAPQIGRAQTGVFYLPRRVAQLVLEEGMELGDADDIVFGRTNSKQANGSIGLLTHDVMTRLDFYVPAVMMALIPFRNPEFIWT